VRACVRSCVHAVVCAHVRVPLSGWVPLCLVCPRWCGYICARACVRACRCVCVCSACLFGYVGLCARAFVCVHVRLARLHARQVPLRSITLHDLRASAAIKRVVLSMKSNALAWNPMEARAPRADPLLSGVRPLKWEWARVGTRLSGS
jgi:hypothetical protein